MTTLARRLGAFDATMIVMGGIIGSGIFNNPSVVAQQLRSAPLILGVWLAGGAIALLGAFVYAELAALRPEAGGQYAYLRDAWHPAVAFLYGWALLLVVQSGGMAVVAVTFGHYTAELFGIGRIDMPLALVTLAALTLINCLGVRSGSNTQTLLMLLKLGALAMLVTVGFIAPAAPADVLPAPNVSLFAIAAAMTPVMFAYGGWHTGSFISAELKNPRRDLAIGMLAGVIGVIVVYVSANVVYLRALGADGLAATRTPASAVMRAVLGERGAMLIAAGIAVSTLGFLSQAMLTTPRIYHAMAEDGLFFRAIARVHPKTRAPLMAIVLQGAIAMIVAMSGTFEQILSYVISVDFIFAGLTGLALFIFRRRLPPGAFRTPGHPVTSALFVIASFVIVAGTIFRAPINSAIGFAILLAGLPAYAFWKRRRVSSSL